MSSSAPWSCGSRRRLGDGGRVHRRPEDRPRRSPHRRLGFVGRLRGINAEAHYSAVGHSYGSVILGEAMSRGLAVDDIVLTGSPGINANSIAETGFGGSVYVGCAAEERWFNLAPFGWDVHGREPCNIEDAFLFDTGKARGHNHYYDSGSLSLRNIAKIVVGKGEGYR